MLVYKCFKPRIYPIARSIKSICRFCRILDPDLMQNKNILLGHFLKVTTYYTAVYT
jgi:hypothetical protein